MAQNDNTLLESGDNIYFGKVEDETAYELDLEADLRSRLVGLVEDRFLSASNARDHDESRWLNSYHNFRGLYPKNVKFRESEKSKVFVKVTKTKVLAAYGQLIDVIFGTGQFPIGVSETKIPEGISTYKHLNLSPTDIEASAKPKATEKEEEPSPFDVGYAGDGKVLKAGATFSKGGSFLEDAIKESSLNFEEGPSPDPQVLEISPAKEAARKMERLIHDQIEESNGASELRSAIFEAALFGTGIIKGPFNFNKTLSRWETDEDTGERTYSPVHVRVPRIEFVSIWDFFPDPNATTIEECEFIVHRHRMNKTQIRALARMPYFNKDSIRECLQLGPNYIEQDYEHELKDDRSSEDYGAGQFEVLEYWGIMEAE